MGENQGWATVDGGGKKSELLELLEPDVPGRQEMIVTKFYVQALNQRFKISEYLNVM